MWSALKRILWPTNTNRARYRLDPLLRPLVFLAQGLAATGWVRAVTAAHTAAWFKIRITVVQVQELTIVKNATTIIIIIIVIITTDRIMMTTHSHNRYPHNEKKISFDPKYNTKNVGVEALMLLPRADDPGFVVESSPGQQVQHVAATPWLNTRRTLTFIATQWLILMKIRPAGNFQAQTFPTGARG